MDKIVPNIWLKQDARKAARFYVKVFKDCRIIRTTSFKNPDIGQVHVVTMKLMDMKVTLTSCISPHELNESFSFIVNCHAQAEIDYYWSALTAGGGQELKYGCLTDKFGVTWQIIPDAFDELMNDTDKERFQRVEAVVLRSQKINIREIMKAYYND